jgi:hypothetical protein
MSNKAFLLRIDQSLYKALESWAQKKMRSVHGEIEYLLKQSLSKRIGLSEKPNNPKLQSQSPQGKQTNT